MDARQVSILKRQYAMTLVQMLRKISAGGISDENREAVAQIERALLDAGGAGSSDSGGPRAAQRKPRTS